MIDAVVNHTLYKQGEYNNMPIESESNDIFIQESFSRLRRLAVGDEELLVTRDGSSSDVGERVFDELREVKALAGEAAARALVAQFREYLRDMEDVQDEYPSIAAALVGIKTFEQELEHFY